jgi:hypothetical protein
MSPDELGHWHDERVFWGRELDALTRGLAQLRQLLERSREEADLEAVGYYTRVIGEYERRLREGRKSAMTVVAQSRAVSFVPMRPLTNGHRPTVTPRARESRPARRARRGAALGDRPRPSDDDDPDQVGNREAAA